MHGGATSVCIRAEIPRQPLNLCNRTLSGRFLHKACIFTEMFFCAISPAGEYEVFTLEANIEFNLKLHSVSSRLYRNIPFKDFLHIYEIRCLVILLPHIVIAVVNR